MAVPSGTKGTLDRTITPACMRCDTTCRRAATEQHIYGSVQSLGHTVHAWSMLPRTFHPVTPKEAPCSVGTLSSPLGENSNTGAPDPDPVLNSSHDRETISLLNSIYNATAGFVGTTLKLAAQLDTGQLICLLACFAENRLDICFLQQSCACQVTDAVACIGPEHDVMTVCCSYSLLRCLTGCSHLI